MSESDESLNDKSPLRIYEDQDGALLYPDEKNDNNRSNFIVSLYNHKVALLLTKKDKKTTIYCHIIASKRKGREIGLYLVYGSELSEDTFEDFRKRGEIVLKEMEFNFSDIEDSSNTIFGNNIVFKNINYFDLGKNVPFFNANEMCLLERELSIGERLTYSGGNRSKITNFVGSFLENIPEFSLCISSMQSEICTINIQSDFQNNDLSPTGNTKIIIARIENQIKEIQENEKKEQEKKSKENACAKFNSAINQLKLRGCSNSSILKYLYTRCLSSDSPIALFIQILVKSECNSNKSKGFSDRERINLTKELIRLFKDPSFGNMLDDRIITDELIKCLSQIKESTDPQDLRTNEIIKELTKSTHYELNELDTAITQLKPYKLNNSDIITYVYQNSILSSPIDQFVKTVVYSDTVFNRKKKLISEDKSKLTNSFIDLFKYLNSKNMLDWKIIWEDEHIKILVKNANPQIAQVEPQKNQTSSSKKAHNSRINPQENLDHLFTKYEKKFFLNSPKDVDSQTKNPSEQIDDSDSGILKKFKKILNKIEKKLFPNSPKDVNSQTKNHSESTEYPESGNENKQNKKNEKQVNAQTTNQSEPIVRLGSGLRKEKDKKKNDKVAIIFLLFLLIMALSLIVVFLIHLGFISFSQFSIGNSTPGLT
jgi:hypothetical protein